MQKKKSSSFTSTQKFAALGLIAAVPVLMAGFEIQSAKLQENSDSANQVLGAKTETETEMERGSRPSTFISSDSARAAYLYLRQRNGAEGVSQLRAISTKNLAGASSSAQFRITEDRRQVTPEPKVPHASELPEPATDSARHFELENGGVTAQTQLPLTVNEARQELNLTTPTGTASINVLPDEALHRLYEDHALSSASAGGAMPPITLTELNNQPTYAVQGEVKKKLFGILPVTFKKTVYVSADNGQTLQTVQSALSKFFEQFSF